MKNFFTSLSVISIILVCLMMMYSSQDWNNGLFAYLFDISMYAPLFISVIGMISACFLSEGGTRKALVTVNSLLFIIVGLLYLVASIGFLEP
ncbi:hypothetical protein [Gracilibacillus alcaliphilus]|uniref:hypothetical protein n=1 Tax=Gracilibacillus alcaliphilus TaxID=1401441 RepID=UPI00195BB812|nr:hypothetical protein [Gracilibacillus alcaliphilus]MBM7678699.1 putative membrane protein [Gracilibacillus alcaliphilus]